MQLGNDVGYRCKPQQKHLQVIRGTHFRFLKWQECQKEDTWRHEINETNSTKVFDQRLLFVSNNCIDRQIQRRVTVRDIPDRVNSRSGQI